MQPGAGAGAAQPRGGGRDPTPEADTGTAHSGSGGRSDSTASGRRACVGARGSGVRPASIHWPQVGRGAARERRSAALCPAATSRAWNRAGERR